MRINRKLKTTFNKVSRLYESARPEYPKSIYSYIKKLSKLKKGEKILDVGCGSGQFTKFFIRNFNATGIDIGENFIKIAKNNNKAKFICTSFEKCKFPKESFDLITSAQAWHWIEPKTSLKKAHKLLKNQGHIAFIWYFTDDSSSVVKKAGKIFDKYQKKYKTYGNRSRLIQYSAETRKKLSSCGFFTNIEKNIYVKNEKFSLERYVAFISTYGWVNNLPEEKRNKMIKEIRKVLQNEKQPFVIKFKYIMLTAQKK